MKEYKKLKKGNYEEKPSKGNVFLVLFLKLENDQKNKFYFNESYFSSKIDNKELAHTVLVSDPEGYPSFFKNFDAGKTDYGFIVWEAPGTLALQRQLLLDYEEDITKYAEGLDKVKILQTYRSIPVFLACICIAKNQRPNDDKEKSDKDEKNFQC